MTRLGERLGKGLTSLRWLPAFYWQRLVRRCPRRGPLHLMIAVADHFEPSFASGAAGGTYASRDEQERRLEEWGERYPMLADPYRDADGYPLRHTYFFPAEQYDKALIERLAEHCHEGWGEIEVHLHHGVDRPDTAESTRRVLVEFRDALAAHGCLSTWEGQGPPRYAFVHGNWALANSARGRYCGVDSEMQILADTGCYADFTLPSAPDPAQTSKINSLYECALPLHRKAPHRRGRDLRLGRAPRVFPLIVQGPLAIRTSGNPGRSFPLSIENGELTARCPPTLNRLRLWQQVGIAVKGRPDWIYIKLHCHGMDPRDRSAMLGPLMQRFLSQLTGESSRQGQILHFVTAREMVNILLASCDGRDGDPGSFRDYRLRPVTAAQAG